VLFRGQESSTPTNVAAEEFGLQNIRPEEFAFGPPGIIVSGAGTSFQRAGVSDWQPTGSTDVNLQFNEQFTWTKGRHTMKYGADLRWLRWDDLGWAIQNGTYTFKRTVHE
jgi:hypothetical protein